MQCRGKAISWKHLAALYYECNQTPGLSIVPKLKYEHIYLNSFSKMTVDLAAQVYTFIFMLKLVQVLSQSVSKAFAIIGNSTETHETAIFCDMFNKFFDCLNVKNYDEGKLSRNPFKHPYRSSEDFRLEVNQYQ